MSPVALKYSLGTKFSLSSSSPSTQQFDGYYRRNEHQTIYGLLTWNSVDTSSGDYTLSLTQVYICSSSSSGDYTPLFDPDGTLYNRGAQFGCAKDHLSLRHRFLILDRQGGESNSNASLFAANFIDTKQHHSISDGFKFNMSTLFNLMPDQTDSTWYVHVFYVIRPTNEPKEVFNNGTNMQIMRLTTHRKSTSSLFSSRVKANRNKLLNRNNKDMFFKELHSRHYSYRDYFLKLVMPIMVCLAFIALVIVSLIYWKKDQIYQFLFVGTGKN